MKGIGIDLTDQDRIRRILNQHPNFIERILTPNEIQLFQQLKGDRQITFLSGRFAAKEAFSKAYGTGIGKAVSFQDIEILNEPSGRPYINRSPYEGSALVSISHDKGLATAIVYLD